MGRKSEDSVFNAKQTLSLPLQPKRSSVGQLGHTTRLDAARAYMKEGRRQVVMAYESVWCLLPC